MKKKFFLSSVFVLVGLLAAYKGHKIKVHLKGMTCQSCAQAIEKSVEKLPEVKSCQVNLEKATAIVTPKPGKKLSKVAIRKAIEKAGYQVTHIKEL